MKNFPELLGSEVLAEDVKVKLLEAWDAKLTEARAEITATLREEFAQRYEHDKGLIVESMDQMITDAITTEIVEFKEDRDELTRSKVAYAKKIREHSQLLNKFVMEALAKEINELRLERKQHSSNIEKLEEFVLHKLTNELNELREDEVALRGARVRLVSEGKQIIKSAKAKFIKEASSRVEAVIAKSLTSEIGQLKEDIQVAKQNSFGRKIMEAFAAEYMASHFADGTELKKLSAKVSSLTKKLDESQKAQATKDNLIADAQRKQRIAEDTQKRGAIMQELMATLARDKREIMKDLLTTVRTDSLRESFEKYLPNVLDNKSVNSGKKTIVESTQSQKTVITGDKIANKEPTATADIVSLRKLAGI